MALVPTAAQTIGPYFAILLPLGSNDLVAADDPALITVSGVVRDVDGAPVADALIEAWQANRHGRYHHPEDTRELLLEADFTGYGRCATDAEGRYSFRTVKPGQVPGEGEAMQAPHITLSIFARGLLHRLVTRVYFPDEAAANAVDPVLLSIAEVSVRETLVARAASQGSYEFDIVLRGENETAFFNV